MTEMDNKDTDEHSDGFMICQGNVRCILVISGDGSS